MHRLTHLLALALLAGCLSGPADPAPPTESDAASDMPPVPERRTVVHAPDGRMLLDAAFGGPLPAFQQRDVPLATAREPMVAAAGGRLYFNGLAFHKSFLWSSVDDGASWEPIVRHPVATVVDGSAQYADPFLHADPVTGRLFMANLFSTDCILIEWSDAPATPGSWDWSTVGDCLEDTGLHDHQSIVTAAPRVDAPTQYPNVVHYCASSHTQQGDAMARCSASRDGGRSWDPLVDTGLDKCSGLTGHLAAAPDGTVFLPQLSCSGPDTPQEAWVAVSRNDGATWDAVLVESREPSPGGTGLTHEGAVAVDAAGNVYYYYLDDLQSPRLVVSRDGGLSWGPGMDVRIPGVTGCTFPGITAGDAGRIALFCIGTTAPGGFQMADETAAQATWHAFVTVSLDALAAGPVFASTVVNDPSDPLARGKPVGEEISVRALTAPVNSMGDFLKVTHDEDGRLFVALVDECHVACSGGGTQNSPRGYGYFPGAVGVQVDGARLRA